MPSHPSDAGFAELQTNPIQQAQSAKKHRIPKIPNVGLPKDNALTTKVSRQKGKTNRPRSGTMIIFSQNVSSEIRPKILATTGQVPSMTALVMAKLIKPYLNVRFQNTSFS